MILGSLQKCIFLKKVKNRFLLNDDLMYFKEIQNKLGESEKIATKQSKGCGGGQVVSVLAFYSDDPSSNPAKVSYYSVNCLKRTKTGWPIKKPKQSMRQTASNSDSDVRKIENDNFCRIFFIFSFLFLSPFHSVEASDK